MRESFNREALRKCDVKFNLLTFSLGNFLFQSYVVDSLYEGETRIFDNVVLCQADVDNQHHEKWVDSIEVGKRVYITINENDWVLKWSDANFQKDRLGRTARTLASKRALYFDFTEGNDVGKTHHIFHKKTNGIVKDFFTTVLNGGKGESIDSLTYDPITNSYKPSKQT